MNASDSEFTQWRWRVGGGPSRKHVAEMAIAARAQDLDAHHAVAAIGLGRDVLVGDRLEEARPAGARIELRVRRKQRQPATDARIDAGALVVEQRAAERPLGAMRARDRELLRRQLFLPLLHQFFPRAEARAARPAARRD